MMPNFNLKIRKYIPLEIPQDMKGAKIRHYYIISSEYYPKDVDIIRITQIKKGKNKNMIRARVLKSGNSPQYIGRLIWYLGRWNLKPLTKTELQIELI
jgi:hypothetical protein